MSAPGSRSSSRSAIVFASSAAVAGIALPMSQGGGRALPAAIARC